MARDRGGSRRRIPHGEPCRFRAPGEYEWLGRVDLRPSGARQVRAGDDGRGGGRCDHSEELYERAGEPRKLIIAPGGAHTTVQHDPELQGAALRWLERELRPR